MRDGPTTPLPTCGRRASCSDEAAGGRARGYRAVVVSRPYDQAIENMRDRVLHGPGAATSEARLAAFAGDVTDELAAYVDKVRRYAYKVTDEDVASLRQRHTDDELIEITLAAAMGAALSRRDAALRAMGRG